MAHEDVSLPNATMVHYKTLDNTGLNIVTFLLMDQEYRFYKRNKNNNLHI